MNRWKIQASLCCDKGKIRKNNEDSYYFNGRFAGLSEMDAGAYLTVETPAAGSLWAVCDGMGGQSSGEVASFTAVSGMKSLQDCLRGQDFGKIIQAWVRQADRTVSERASGGGTTLAMLYCGEKAVRIAHVGDSRVYRFRGGKLEQMTRDHSKVEMLVKAGVIKPEEARTHPQKNLLIRWLGMNEEYPCEATVTPEILPAAGDRYILCSDGVTDMLTDAEITALAARSAIAGSCAANIRDAVLAAGARDNMTVIVLDLTLSS